MKPEAEQRGIKLTLLAFIMRACAQALLKLPEINASLYGSGNNLVLKKYCHIGFATDTPVGLLGPVVRDVDKKSLFEIADAIGMLAGKVRNGQLAFADAEGGCFSVSNLGQLGGNGFTPTINAPEVAVPGVARAARKVVELDGQLSRSADVAALPHVRPSGDRWRPGWALYGCHVSAVGRTGKPGCLKSVSEGSREFCYRPRSGAQPARLCSRSRKTTPLAG